MMKFSPLFVLFLAVNTYANETYECSGVDADSKAVSMTLSFQGDAKVHVATDEGSEYELDESTPTSRNRIYGDYEHDGYGGSIELRLPRRFTPSGAIASKMVDAKLVVETFSEIGHVGTEIYKTNCERIDY